MKTPSKPVIHGLPDRVYQHILPLPRHTVHNSSSFLEVEAKNLSVRGPAGTEVSK